ncbi:MAG: hypothetical protein ACLQDY_14910 [Streptosporangiaceae bacterium]
MTPADRTDTRVTAAGGTPSGVVAYFSPHAPFLPAAVVVLTATALMASLRRALSEADTAESQPGHSDLRDAEEEAASLVPGDPDEAIIAEHALRKDDL